MEEKKRTLHTYQLPGLSPSKQPITSYVNIPEGFIGRFILGETPHGGLYTDEVANCSVYIVFGKRDKEPCFSLIHANATTTPKLIEDEFEWIKADAKIMLIRHQINSSENPRMVEVNLASLIHKCTKIETLPQEFNAVFVSISPNSELNILFHHTKNKRHLPLINHPNALTIYSAYMFNIAIAGLYGHMESFKPELKISSESSYSNRMTNILLQYSPKERLFFDGTHFKKIEVPEPNDQIEPLYTALKEIFSSSTVTLEKIYNAICRILTEDAKKMGITFEQYLQPKPKDLRISITLAGVWFSYSMNLKTTVVEKSGNPGLLMLVNAARRYSNREELSKLKALPSQHTHFQRMPMPTHREKILMFKLFMFLTGLSYVLLRNEAHSTPANIAKAFMPTIFIAALIYCLKHLNTRRSSVEIEEVHETEEDRDLEAATRPKTI